MNVGYKIDYIFFSICVFVYMCYSFFIYLILIEKYFFLVYVYLKKKIFLLY